MRFLETSVLPIDVQFEDVDAGGAVHHPNYLRFIERGRYAGIRGLGIAFEEQLREGSTFVVAEVAARYSSPLAMGERIYVLTRTVAMRRSSLKVFHAVVRSEPSQAVLSEVGDDIFSLPSLVFAAQLRLVYVNINSGKAIEVPPAMRAALGMPNTDLPLDRRDTRLGNFGV